MTDKPKCDPRRTGSSLFCESLSDRLNESNARGKGLSTYETFDMERDVYTMQGVVYKTSQKDKGLMLNHCPWCGESLKWWSVEPKVERAAVVQKIDSN